MAALLGRQSKTPSHSGGSVFWQRKPRCRRCCIARVCVAQHNSNAHHRVVYTSWSIAHSLFLYLSGALLFFDSIVHQQIRASVAGIKQRLELGLAIVAAMAAGCPSFIQQRLDQLMQYVTPLLASPLVGESGAYEAALALARCLPPPQLATAAVPIAAALRLVQMSAATGASARISQSTNETLHDLLGLCSPVRYLYERGF